MELERKYVCKDATFTTMHMGSVSWRSACLLDGIEEYCYVVSVEKDSMAISHLQKESCIAVFISALNDDDGGSIEESWPWLRIGQSKNRLKSQESHLTFTSLQFYARLAIFHSLTGWFCFLRV